MANREIELATKLLMLTIDNKVQWEKKETPSISFKGTEGSLYSYYETEYKNKNFAIYIFIYRIFNHEQEWDNNEVIRLALLNEEKTKILWESSREVIAMRNLLSRIIEQTSNIDEVIANLG